MAVNKNGIVVIGAVFVDIKGFPEDIYIPDGRNAGRIEYIHGGVSRNVVEDIANIELRPTFLGIVDDSALGSDVIHKLQNHKVNTDKEIVKKVVSLCEKFKKPLYGVVSNMSIAAERRDFLRKFDCFICNQLEAGMFFSDDYSEKTPEALAEILAGCVKRANIPSMVVTMGGKGAVYADREGTYGICPAKKVQVKDTTGAGDAFCAGVASGLTYGKTLEEAVEIGTRLAASVITSSENVCPRFLPAELGIDA